MREHVYRSKTGLSRTRAVFAFTLPSVFSSAGEVMPRNKQPERTPAMDSRARRGKEVDWSYGLIRDIHCGDGGSKYAPLYFSLSNLERTCS